MYGCSCLTFSIQLLCYVARLVIVLLSLQFQGAALFLHARVQPYNFRGLWLDLLHGALSSAPRATIPFQLLDNAMSSTGALRRLAQEVPRLSRGIHVGRTARSGGHVRSLPTVK